MKTINILLAIVFSTVTLFAQDDEYHNYQQDDEFKTLFGRSSGNGGYGAVSIGYTQINKIDAVTFSGRGGVIFGHGLAMGITGTGYVTDYFYDNQLRDEVNIAGGYGGFFIEPILFPKFPVHLFRYPLYLLPASLFLDVLKEF